MISSIVIVDFTTDNSSSSDEPKSPFTTLMIKSAFGGAIDTLVKRYAWVYTPLYALIPGTLVAISYRFDYQNHLDTTDTADQFILATIPAPEPKCGKILGGGVIIPHRAPSSFPKVYYTTSLVAFAFSQVLLAVALAYTDCVQLTSSFEFGSLAMLVDLPVICFSLMAVATMRREWKAFWSYRCASLLSILVPMPIKFSCFAARPGWSKLTVLPRKASKIISHEQRPLFSFHFVSGNNVR